VITPSDEAPSEDIAINGGAPASQRTAQAIAEADWLIFALLDATSLNSSSLALQRLLDQRSEPLSGTRIVVFALHAPYFLDATEIGKLSLYYGVYSKTDAFLETAVRALFRGFTPDGAPSVSAPGTRFASLTERLAADPNLMIPLQITDGANVLASNSVDTGAETSTDPPAALAVAEVGDTLRIEAGPILDRNGNIAPNGTIVSFVADFEGAELTLSIEPGVTRGGMAQRDVVLERGGVLRVAASAGEATSGEPLVLTVLEPQIVATEAVAGAPAVIAPPVVEMVPATPAVVTATSQGGTVDGTTADGSMNDRVNGLSLALTLLTMLIALGLLLLVQIRILPRETLFISLLWAMIAGLGVYLLYGLGWLPGSDWISQTLGIFGAPLLVFVAMLLPLFWLQLRNVAGERM
jgi:beta-N-acetylhexosaminidase